MASDRQDTALGRVTVVGAKVAGVAVLAMMLIGASDVVATLLGFPLAGAVELMEMLMVLVIFLALPEVEARQRHIAVDLLLQRFPVGARRLVTLASNVLGLLFFGAMAWQGWKLFWQSWLIREYASGSVAFPIYPTKALFAIGVTVIGIVAFVNLVRSLTREQPGQ